MIKKVLVRVIYTLVGMGAVSCAWEQVTPQIDCSSSPVVIQLLSRADTPCGESSGSFSIVATGGEPPYSYTSVAGNSADGIYDNLSVGTYEVTVSDSKGCKTKIGVTIQNLNGVNVNSISTTAAGCGVSGGSIQIEATGGVEPYLFSINGSTQQVNLFTGLSRGTYTVDVRDQDGCEASQSVDVTSGVSYANSIKGIIENSCAISGCHNGSVSPDLRSFGTIQARASSIKSRTGNRSMPRGSTLSQSQIDMIACWVDDGALQN